MIGEGMARGKEVSALASPHTVRPCHSEEASTTRNLGARRGASPRLEIPHVAPAPFGMTNSCSFRGGFADEESRDANLRSTHVAASRDPSRRFRSVRDDIWRRVEIEA